MKIVFAVLLSACTGIAAAQTSSTVDDIVGAHITALGGAGKIHAIHSFVLHGTYHEGDLNTKTTVTQMRPFYRVIGNMAEPLKHLHEGYDGSSWEYYPDPGIVVRTVGAAAATTRHSALFDDALVDYRERGTTIVPDGATDFAGGRAYLLHVTLADGFREDIFVDVKTYMIAGYVRIVPFHAFGTRYTTHMEMSDYRPEGAVMMPHRSREVDSATGKVFDEGTVETVDINPDLPLAIFSPPVWQRTPLQQMIQRIYDERSDTSAVLQTYRDFRPLIPPGTSTADAVDFVGYQCLKMGDNETAVTLLKQNVADNPQSARAHFGLGRALKTQGRAADANAEFDRALAINPNFIQARTARDALQ
ncbi:MAG TPA: tetratricopeptide repeat protein [Bryocella sp.]|nr:tetratricopeptide repeat protein [Bryocella sp.]